MTVLVDTSVIIDVLRGREAARQLLREARQIDRLHASEVTRLEVLAGMRPHEEPGTRTLLATFWWHPVDEGISEIAGELGRQWLPGNRGIDTADLAIAATVTSLGAELFTLNVKHFPMFPALRPPY